jgi:hypothetical protein
VSVVRIGQSIQSRDPIVHVEDRILFFFGTFQAVKILLLFSFRLRNMLGSPAEKLHS